MTIYGFGEILLRYTPPQYEQLKDAHNFSVKVGGTELNALVTLAQFGHQTEIVTVLPPHALGNIASQKIVQSNVGAQFVKKMDGRIGTYYMEESFGFRSGNIIYDRENSTFAQHGDLALNELNRNIQSGDYFVFTGITLAVNESFRNQIVQILTTLKQQGVFIVFDINYRSNLWSKSEAVSVIQSVLPLVDILFFGEKDATHLLEINSMDDDIKVCAKTIQDQYEIPIIASSNRDIEESTLQGIILSDENYIQGQAYTYTVLNRIGAGDAFMAGVLHGLIHRWGLKETIDFATKCSVMQHTTTEDALSVSENDVLKLSSHFGELKR
ncbi:sugar kinase [Staphylococcus succinus]|uniref:sugar kinase n=1 Tax=Staphylococcus succinus TaxID=61015 RepID=UPI002DBE1B30|nr:sugar kinase [Staphylococcus succinus]MEB8125013.1 sugar kinase [Staphylococcus succinus]